MSVQDHDEQIRRDRLRAFLARDTAWTDRHVSPGLVHHGRGLPFEVRGPQGVLAPHHAPPPAFRDMGLPFGEFVAEGGPKQPGALPA